MPHPLIPAGPERQGLREGEASDQLIDLQGTIEILLVPPPGYVERRDGHAVEPRREALSLPERVVVGMVDEVVPRRNLPPEKPRIDRRERAKLQIPPVGIVAVEHGGQ